MLSQRFRLDVIRNPYDGPKMWIRDTKQGVPVCKVQDIKLGQHLVSLLNAPSTREDWDQIYEELTMLYGQVYDLRVEAQAAQIRADEAETELAKMRGGDPWYSRLWSKIRG